MIMKNGSVVPKSFAQALEKDTKALMVFMKMTATYQERCVNQIMNSEESSPRKRIQAVIVEILKFGRLRGWIE